MKDKSGFVGCLTILFIIAINLTIGTWSVIEILSWFGKQVSIFAAAVIGLFVGELSIPVAIVGWILKTCGVF